MVGRFFRKEERGASEEKQKTVEMASATNVKNNNSDLSASNIIKGDFPAAPYMRARANEVVSRLHLEAAAEKIQKPTPSPLIPLPDLEAMQRKVDPTGPICPRAPVKRRYFYSIRELLRLRESSPIPTFSLPQTECVQH